MKRTDHIILIALSGLIFLFTGCGFVQKNTGEDNSITPVNTGWLYVNTRTTVAGTGNVILKKITVFSYPNLDRDFSITKEGIDYDSRTVLSYFSARSGDYKSLHTSELTDPGETLQVWRVNTSNYGTACQSQTNWDIIPPTNAQNVIYENFVSIPSVEWPTGKYLDVSELAIATENSAINWDIKLVSFNSTFYSSDTKLQIVANQGCGVYFVPFMTNMNNYRIDPAAFTTTSSYTYEQYDNFPIIIFKTKENNYGYLTYSGYNIYNDVLTPRMDVYYFRNGETTLYDPLYRLPK